MLEGREFFVLTYHQLSATPWADSLLPGLPANSTQQPMSPSSRKIFDTFLERKMWPQTPNHACPSFPAWRLQTFHPFSTQAACSAMVALEAYQRFHVEKRLLADGLVLLCSTSTGMDHPLLPPDFSLPAFDALSHPGVCGSCCLLTPRLLKPGMNKEVRF